MIRRPPRSTLFPSPPLFRSRGLQEFATAPSAWSAQSHVNRFYLERGMRMITRALADLRRQAPAPAPRTTFFFGGLPQFASRSEEHTSELQSQSNLVCRLLLA